MSAFDFSYENVYPSVTTTTLNKICACCRGQWLNFQGTDELLNTIFFIYMCENKLSFATFS